MTYTLPLIILLVEADPSTREITAIVLKAAGYRVLTASNGDVALTILLIQGDVSVLVSNIDMPGDINGIELAKRGAALFPSLGVVLTSHETDALDEDFPGAALFLLKPYDRKGLLMAVLAVTPH